MSRIKNLLEKLPEIKDFVGISQVEVMADGVRTADREFFFEAFDKIYDTIITMPKPYETDGQGRDAIVHLHYYLNGMDWYIMERDGSAEQHQAFGYACLGMGMDELGYISILELIENGAELDLHWTPKELWKVQAANE